MRSTLRHCVVATLLCWPSLLQAQDGAEAPVSPAAVSDEPAAGEQPDVPEPVEPTRAAPEEPAPTGEPAPTDATATPLVIDTPTAGATVQLPFTIHGRAEPGANLELWIDDALVRAFRADADGNFIVPVTRRADSSLLVKEAVEGELGEAVTLDVTWSTQPAPTQQVPHAPTQQLPQVEAAVIPEPAELGALPEVQPPPAAVVYSGNVRRFPRGVRAIAEAGAGLGGAVSVGAVGGLIGLGLGAMSTDGFGVIGAGGIGVVVGALIGLPIGVVLVGNVMDGNGKIGFVVLGELLGVAAAVGISALSRDGAAGTIAVLTLPVTGTVLGYELSSDASAADARRGITWSPAVGASVDGEATVGFRLTF